MVYGGINMDGQVTKPKKRQTLTLSVGFGKPLTASPFAGSLMADERDICFMKDGLMLSHSGCCDKNVIT